MQDSFRRIEVGIGAWLPVRSKRHFKCCGRRRSAETGIAVHVRCTDAGLPNHRQRVIFFQEQLARCIKAENET